MSSTFIQSYEQNPFPQVTFILYPLTSLVCLCVYTWFYTRVFKSENPMGKCFCDPMKFGYTIMIIVGMPILANLAALTDGIVDLIGYYNGQDLSCSFAIEIVMGLFTIVSLSIVTFFQMKIAGIAAIQRC